MMRMSKSAISEWTVLVLVLVLVLFSFCFRSVFVLFSFLSLSLATLATLVLASSACKTRGLFFLVVTLLVRIQALVYQNVFDNDNKHIQYYGRVQ